MIVQGYAGSTVAKTSLAVLSKVSTTTFALTFGTAVVAVLAAAVLVAQLVDLKAYESEDPGKKD